MLNLKSRFHLHSQNCISAKFWLWLFEVKKKNLLPLILGPNRPPYMFNLVNTSVSHFVETWDFRSPTCHRSDGLQHGRHRHVCEEYLGPITAPHTWQRGQSDDDISELHLSVWGRTLLLSQPITPSPRRGSWKCVCWMDLLKRPDMLHSSGTSSPWASHTHTHTLALCPYAWQDLWDPPKHTPPPPPTQTGQPSA